MGADGHGSAGLPEISEDRVPRSVLITCADAPAGPTAPRLLSVYRDKYTAHWDRLN